MHRADRIAAGQFINYEFLTSFMPRVVDVFVRDEDFWADNSYLIQSPRTRLHVLAYVYSGTGSLNLDSNRQPLETGTIFHVAPDHEMLIQVDPDEPACFYSIWFNYTLVRWRGQDASLTRPTTPLPFPIAMALGRDLTLEQIFSNAHQVWNDAIVGYEWYAKAGLIEALHRICQLSSARNAAVSPTSRAIDTAIDYIKAHIETPLQRGTVAAHVGLSDGYFSTAFKQRTGYSFSKYVRGIRIDEAKRYLRTTELSIRTIAQLVGFQDAFYFSRCFRSATGLSPRVFRNM